MSEKMFQPKPEAPKIGLYTAPAVESLTDPSQTSEAWPESVAKNQEFQAQLEDRQKLKQRLDDVLVKLPRPDMSLQEAIIENHITEDQVADLYISLADLLEDDDYKRLALYLPFEFLPNTNWEPSSSKLKDSAEQFRLAYMKAWDSLLDVQDVRANFVDGDVLDVVSRKGDLPRVVKAAHLIPKLVENGLLTLDEVFEFIENNEDEIFKGSVADTLPVLADMGFIKQAEVDKMKESNDSFMREAATLIESGAGKIKTTEAQDFSLASLQEKLQSDFDSIDAEAYTGITDKRIAWLRKDKKDKAVDATGTDISDSIITNKLDDKFLTDIISPEANVASQLAFVAGIRKAIEASIDQQQAESLYKKYSPMLLTLWEKDDVEIRKELSKTFSRLNGLGIVDKTQLEKLEISIPSLAGPFSENLKNMEADMKEIQEIAKAIEADSELSKYIYPTVLVFGSLIKGYGAEDPDIDVGIFIKPNTSNEDLEKVRAKIKDLFSHEKIQGEVVEFWLDQNEDGLEVHDFEEPSPLLGDSYWTHVLFGGAWTGNQAEIKKLRQELLTPYFYDDEKEVQGREARGVYLEELERDTLQYRLLQKGYERFMPPVGGIDTPHADKIDGDSAFWDSGFRQTATKLFASRVFLPKISK